MRSLMIALTIVLLWPATVLARGPKLEELPTIRAIIEEADAEIEAARAAAEAAARDDKMERIHAYEEGRVSLYDYKTVVDLLKDDKEEMKYRQAASLALRNRFKDLTSGDDRLKKLKKQIGGELIFDLNDSNEEIRVWVAAVFQTLWPGTYGDIGFNPKETVWAKRNKTWREWRKFLAR